MFSEPVVSCHGLGKLYQIYSRPQDRLKQFLWRGRRQYFREFWALRDVSFELRRGEVLGLVGRNGSGKSTLLQLICGTLNASCGEVAVSGRVAALLELGAGFNPEFTGRENAYMNAAILGLDKQEVDARFAEIAAFADIGEFIDQPVKTYSSGMYMRLAFSVAVCVDPDILVIDEALSVGDGEFSRKSFDRIMDLKKAGKTILFCSHSLYQVEAICNRALWLHKGQVRLMGEPATVVSAYNTFLASESRQPQPAETNPQVHGTHPVGFAQIVHAEVEADGAKGDWLPISSGQSDVTIRIAFLSDPSLPIPSVAAMLSSEDGRAVASCGSRNDGVVLQRNADGRGEVTLTYPRIPLLKGNYHVDIYLMCEEGIHIYDQTFRVATLTVTQHDLEQGMVRLPHTWTP